MTVFVYSSGKLVAEYSTATPPEHPTINYTATDMLGSPRVVTNAIGEVVSRRDFMPFGEEIPVDAGNRDQVADVLTIAKVDSGGNLRTTSLNYQSGPDAVRQRFTGYQKDTETSLDFAEARMYENRYGRFTAVDPLLASGKSSNPQTFNRYVYCLNHPLKLTDPSGLQSGTKPQGADNVITDDEILHVDTYWDRVKNTFGTYAGLLKSLGISVAENVRGFGAGRGGDLSEATIKSPETQQFKNLANQTASLSINSFNANMNDLNEGVIKRTPFLGNLTNAGMAGLHDDHAGFAKEMGLFYFDLATTFSGGGTTRRIGQEGLQLTGTRLAQFLGREGEEAVGIFGPKIQIPSLTETAARRFPDLLTSTELVEVKNVGHLNFTNQLIDYQLYAKQEGLTFTIFTRGNTTFSKSLDYMFKTEQIQHKIIPFH